jgi:hypothetical protein
LGQSFRLSLRNVNRSSQNHLPDHSHEWRPHSRRASRCRTAPGSSVSATELIQSQLRVWIRQPLASTAMTSHLSTNEISRLRAGQTRVEEAQTRSRRPAMMWKTIKFLRFWQGECGKYKRCGQNEQKDKHSRATEERRIFKRRSIES